MKKRFFSIFIAVSVFIGLLPTYVVQAEHCPGNYDVLFSTYNYGATNNGPTEDVIVTVDKAKMVKEITTYHWNNGYGKAPGSVSIYKDGALDGTWNATARGGSGATNVNWDVFPDYVMEPDHTYKIVDSDIASWSCNEQSGYRGFVEICGYTAGEGTTDPTEAAKAKALEESGLYAMTITGAGAAQIDTWASYGRGKGSVMFPVMSLTPMDWEEPIGYFFPASSEPTLHKLTVYGSKHIEESDITIAGARSSGVCQETVYGEDEEALYAYTVPFTANTEDFTVSVKVDGQTVLDIPCTHIPPEAPHPYVTNLYPEDYTENKDGYLESFTVKIGGFSLPDDKSAYNFQQMVDSQWYNKRFAECTAISEKDEYGEFTLTFTIKNEGIEVGNLQWIDLLIDDSMVWFFSKADHLSSDYNGFYYYNGQEQGSNARIASPYAAAKKAESTVKSPKFSVPEEADETPVDIGITPNDYEGGKLCYSTDGGKTWSAWANIGSSISVPLSNGNGDYDIVFKYKKDGLEEKQSKTYTVTLEVPDKDPEVVPAVTLPTVTTTRNIEAKITAGSYAGGKYAYTTDGWETFTDYMPVSSKVNITLPDEYGVYFVAFIFVKEGYISYETEEIAVDYNDGMAAAPTLGGIIDASSGKEVLKKGDSYVISGDKDSVYRIYAVSPEGQTLEAIFKNADGTAAVTKTLSFNSETKQYEAKLTREDMKNAASVDLRVKATGGGLAGHELTLKLKFVEKAFIKALYAPTVSYDVKKDESGTYYALKPGAVISGAFESAAGEDRTHQMTLTYLTASDESKTVTANAKGDENGQYYATITLPEDAASLKQISYELLDEGKVESSETYNVENYRVEANTNVTGIGDNYIGTTFTIKGTDTDKAIILTEKNYNNIPLGDIKTGEYTYEISGTSGHIAGGTVSVVRDSDITLSDLPALGSVTAQTTGFVSKNSGKELNPKANVVLNLTTPDGKEIKVHSAAGEKMEQLPIGSTGSAILSYDESAYDEIQSLKDATQDITVNGNESITASYLPYTYRTIKGSVFATKIFKSKYYPNGYESIFVPWDVKVVVTQEINRGDHTETVVQTTTTTNGLGGNWSVKCYDNIPAKVEIRAFGWSTETFYVTENGDKNFPNVVMKDKGETVVEIKANVQTPASINADGKPRQGAVASQSAEVDSSFIHIYAVSSNGHRYTTNDIEIETFVEDGRTFARIPEGVVVGNEYLYLYGSGSVEYADMSLTVSGDVSVGMDEYGQLVATFTAINQGGEIRATVVDDPNSGMTGFLALYYSDNWCTFVEGTGELSLAYNEYQANPNIERTVVTMMVRQEDAADFAEILRTKCKTIYDLLPNGDRQHDAYFTLRDYNLQYCYKKTGLLQNRVIYFDDMTPKKVVGTELLPPYRFNYHFEASENPGKVWVIGSLEKRFPEEKDKDAIRSFKLYIPDNNSWGSYIEEENLTVESGFYANGREIYSWSCWAPEYCDTASIVAEIPITNSNVAAFKYVLQYGNRNSLNEDKQIFFAREHIPMFSIISPGDLYIADQLKSQKLDRKPEEVQATWTVNLPMRVYHRDNAEENIIKIYDNGVVIKEFSVTAGRAGTGFTGGSFMKVPVRLTNNLKAGIHVIWAERTLDGEPLQTEPIVFSLVEGTEHNEVYVSELHWTHWNSRISGQPDVMYFENLSELAGANIWVWPGKRHQMRFKVNNATSKELESVVLHYTTLSDRNLNGYTSVGGYVPCRLIEEDRNANYSIWGFDDADLGYLEGFEFQFHYNFGTLIDLDNKHVEDLDAAANEAFYKAYGLGDVPDIDALAEGISDFTDEDMKNSIAAMSGASQVFKGMDLRVTEDTNKSFKMELKTPTDEISQYTVTMKDSGTENLPDIWLLMENERANGNQNPDEKGWDVTWSEFDTKQGSVLIRTATFEGDMPDGRGAILSHSTYYITKSVADKLTGGGASLMSAAESDKPFTDDMPLSLQAIAFREGIPNVISNEPQYEELPDHWVKQKYDFVAILYGGADIGYQGLQNFIWADRGLKSLGWAPLTMEEATKAKWDKIAGWGDKPFAKGLNKTFQILGVADAVYTISKGPTGNDPASLRAMLSLVRDEKARQSLEWQIRDYEQMRKSIYKNDCTMSSISAASGFVPGMGIIGKVVTFIGGLGNSILSGKAKEDNAQVYNSTLHDIKREIEYERRRIEVHNNQVKSYLEAEQWLRDKMDSIYGKGHWSEYALAEERKNWVLMKFPGGVLRYVWKDSAPKFDVYLDPSGYVFEGSEDNRIEDVKATLYYSDTEDGNYSIWKDNSGEQYNPQYTGDEGRYSWMVPNGWWKVRYEKEGYIPALSNPMAVPPIHTAVNIGLLSTTAPKAAVRADDGKMTVLFSNYMQLESLIRLFENESYDGNEFDASAFAIRFYDKDGVAIPGTVTFPDKIANTGYIGSAYSRAVIDSDWFVRTAIFTPADKTVDLTGATWTFADGIKSYSGVELDKTGTPENLYLITLNAGDGTLSIPSLITNSKGSLSKLPAPVLEGYVFEGWYTSANGGDKIDLDTVFDKNTDVFAHWSVDESKLPANSGGGGINSYAVSTKNIQNGKIDVTPKTAPVGGTVTVTVTPDAGYKLDKLTVKDKKGNEVTVTEKSGKYTFVMPEGGVDITPVFVDENGNGSVNPFTDVKDSDYFYDAVLWAVKENITSGTSDTAFSPNEPCTRGQTVTFLWRFAGSPKPTADVNPFTDIKAGDYFYEAVLWAYENGITKGTSDTAFSPNNTVTRGQTVTFLYRLKGEKTNAENPFTDVKTGDYYYDPVLWANEKGVTNGTSDTTFSPGNDCLRGQIVTFLYRAGK